MVLGVIHGSEVVGPAQVDVCLAHPDMAGGQDENQAALDDEQHLQVDVLSDPADDRDHEAGYADRGAECG